MNNKYSSLLSYISITAILIIYLQCLNPEAYCLSIPSINEITDITRIETEVLLSETLDRCLPIYYEQMKLMIKFIEIKDYKELLECMERIRNKTKMEFSHYLIVDIGKYIYGDLLVTAAFGTSLSKFLAKEELLEKVEEFENAVEELLKLKEKGLLTKVRDTIVKSGVIDSNKLLNADAPLSSL